MPERPNGKKPNIRNHPSVVHFNRDDESILTKNPRETRFFRRQPAESVLPANFDGSNGNEKIGLEKYIQEFTGGTETIEEDDRRYDRLIKMYGIDDGHENLESIDPEITVSLTEDLKDGEELEDEEVELETSESEPESVHEQGEIKIELNDQEKAPAESEITIVEEIISDKKEPDKAKKGKKKKTLPWEATPKLKKYGYKKAVPEPIVPNMNKAISQLDPISGKRLIEKALTMLGQNSSPTGNDNNNSSPIIGMSMEKMKERLEKKKQKE